MPMSWLTPGLAVQRSALAPMIELVSTPGVTGTLRAASIGCQLAPSELGSVYWLGETAQFGATPVGKLSAIRLVGEETGPPAAAEIVAAVAGRVVGLFRL